MSEKAIKELSRRARGTPRISLKLLKRARDFAQVKGKEDIDEEVLNDAFGLLEIDSMGLDDSDRRLLLSLIEKHNGGPVGIETMAATLSEDIGTLEEVVERNFPLPRARRRGPTPTAGRGPGRAASGR